jgi:hypothetical protein
MDHDGKAKDSQNVSTQVLYHGTRADLNPSDLIAPGYASNVHDLIHGR